MTRKTILIISGGIEAVPGIQLAKRMGLHVVVSDINPNAPGFAFADDKIFASTYDVDGTIAAAKHYHNSVRPIDGVICIASDVPLTVASVAAALGLPGIPLESARLATDKLAMKERFFADGVPIPWFSPVESADHLRKLAKNRGLPLVLKPVDSRGARGVLRLTLDMDIDWAFQVSREHSPTGRVMVEKFVPGPQVSTESLVLDGVAHTIGFSDRNYEFLERYAPHIIENGGQLPSHLPKDTQAAVRDVVQEAATSFRIRNGVVKGDIVVSDGRPYVIELAARLSGGYFCTHEIPLNTGVSFVRHAIRLALGENIDPADLVPKYDRGVAQRYIFPKPGRVTRISGLDQVSARPEIAFCEIRIAVGDIIGPMDRHPARAGVLIAIGENRKEAIISANCAVQEITIETVP